jgi:hypothetical protein
MSKREQARSNTAGSYVWRDAKSGRFNKVVLLRPKNPPSSATEKQIQHAVRAMRDAAHKTK